MNMKVTVIPDTIGARGSHHRIGTGTGELGNKRKSKDHPNYSIIKIDFCRLEKICCHSNSNEKQLANVGV